MRTCVHARINAGMTQFFLLARLLLFENPYSPESLLLAKRCIGIWKTPCLPISITIVGEIASAPLLS